MKRGTQTINPLISIPCWNVLRAINERKTFQEIQTKTRIKESSLFAYLSVLSRTGLIKIDKNKNDKRSKIYHFTGDFSKLFFVWLNELKGKGMDMKVYIEGITSMKDGFNELITNYYFSTKLPYVRNFQTLFESFYSLTLGFADPSRDSSKLTKKRPHSN